jgi:glycosyltransferase involved in cell wall biosynthesis
VPEVWFAIPGDPSTLTGGYLYDRRVMETLPAYGWAPRLLRLPAGFPAPSTADIEETRRAFARIPSGSLVVVDGLAFGAIPKELIGALLLRWVALVHHPLAQETGVTPQDAIRLARSEKAALSEARAVIVTSPHTAETLEADYRVPREKITVAPPGVERRFRARERGSAVRLLTVATLTPRKAPEMLIEALRRIRHLDWTSKLVGNYRGDPPTTERVRRLIARYGMERRVRLVGELTGAALEAAYTNADLFVLPSRHEGYGMAFAEALAHGLPVVGCAVGAVPDTVPNYAGLLVPPDDPETLAAVLEGLIGSGPLRRCMAKAAWRHGRNLPRWSDTARIVAQALGRVPA